MSLGTTPQKYDIYKLIINDSELLKNLFTLKNILNKTTKMSSDLYSGYNKNILLSDGYTT